MTLVHTKRLWISALILAIIIVAGFILSVPHTHDAGNPPARATQEATIPDISVHDIFRRGTHTLSGSVVTPNACTSISAHASLVGTSSSTQTIQIAILMPQYTGLCLQAPTTVAFSTTIAAPAHTPITATVNGSLATTTAS
ncbi:MAG: hypothetical protein WAN50_03125 [Minisyncoccia bacterium]